MTMTPPRVVLDASAALEWLLARKHKHVIAKLLPVAVLPASALTEALYNAVLAGHALDPQSLYDALLVAGVRIEPVTAVDSIRAGELIASTRLANSAAGSLSLGRSYESCLSLFGSNRACGRAFGLRHAD